jgi:hypothetical protein
MGAPINETTIINRCKKENSYEERLKNKTLPIRENKKCNPFSDNFIPVLKAR